MNINLFQTPEYRSLMEKHISDSIEYLFHKNQEFAVACEVKHIVFTPDLPSDIKESFENIVLFILSGFTFESAKLEEGYFSFEAGFGSDNFGSIVSLPLLAIKQLFVGDNPIVINLAHPSNDTGETKKPSKAFNKSSMEALLNNPENKKLLRKKK